MGLSRSILKGSKQNRLTILILALLFCSTACNKSSSGGATNQAEFTSVSSKSQIVGTWKLSTYTVSTGTVTSSGNTYYRFSPNGTFTVSLEQFSSAFNGQRNDSSCWEVGNGEYQLNNGEITLTARKHAALSGTCSGSAAPYVKSCSDLIYTASIAGSELKILFTETISQNGATSTLNSTIVFSKSSEDIWDGTGPDPAFLKSWALSKILIYEYCLNGTLDSTVVNQGELTFTGSKGITLTASTYNGTATNYLASGETTSCTGTESGNVSWAPLTFTTTQISSSVSCLASTSTTLSFARDLIAKNNKMYSFYSLTTTNSNCPYSDKNTVLSVITEFQ